METVQKGSPRTLQTSKELRKDEKRIAIKIEEITLREITIYAEADDINIAEMLKKLMTSV